jgi:L-asparagine transporter-like permease
METSYFFVIFLILIVVFLIIATLVMALYNYTVPKLIMSVNNKYKSSDFTPISFGSACTLTILCGLLFGSSTVCLQSSNLKSTNN